MEAWLEMSTAASAALASPQKGELLLFYTLLELTVIVLAGRLGGAAARRCGQSAAVGEIIIGILLGPSLFGWLSPRTFDFVFHSASAWNLISHTCGNRRTGPRSCACRRRAWRCPSPPDSRLLSR
jgi:hypothetical protein